jgi:hypothetical protein
MGEGWLSPIHPKHLKGPIRALIASENNSSCGNTLPTHMIILKENIAFF